MNVNVINSYCENRLVFIKKKKKVVLATETNSDWSGFPDSCYSTKAEHKLDGANQPTEFKPQLLHKSYLFIYSLKLNGRVSVGNKSLYAVHPSGHLSDVEEEEQVENEDAVEEEDDDDDDDDSEDLDDSSAEEMRSDREDEDEEEEEEEEEGPDQSDPGDDLFSLEDEEEEEDGEEENEEETRA